MARQKLFATALFASIILENSSGPHNLMGVFVDRRTEQKMVFLIISIMLNYVVWQNCTLHSVMNEVRGAARGGTWTHIPTWVGFVGQHNWHTAVKKKQIIRLMLQCRRETFAEFVLRMPGFLYDGIYCVQRSDKFPCRPTQWHALSIYSNIFVRSGN